MGKFNLVTIDEFLKQDHFYLNEDDECFYFMEYYPKVFDSVKSTIMNFKKKMDQKGKAGWGYKAKAIKDIADIFIQSVPPFTKPVILVPIPPSKKKDDLLYDDRIIQLLSKFCASRTNCEMREIISLEESLVASHDVGLRPSPDELIANFKVDFSLCKDNGATIFLVDDVLTTGSHFKACKTILQQFFPKSRIAGLFIARRAIN
ncbi:MAG: hypothetical protein ACXVKI_08550 [Flavisolibacter sp.]